MIKKLGLFLLVGFFYTSYTAWSAGAQQFSADMISRSPEGSFQGKVYVGNEKMRMEMPQSIMITRLDQNVTWMIMPEQNMYMEHAMDRAMMAKTSTEFPGELERLSMGQETVDGVAADKFKVTYTDATGTVSVYQWIDSRGMLVKSEAVDGSWSVAYQNISVGPQPDSLFEVPEGYQKFAMPSMKDLMAQAQGVSESAYGDSYSE